MRMMQAWAKRRQKDQRQESLTNAQLPRVVQQIRKEGAAAGATLANGGRGGLDPRLALKVFRRDNWTCTVKDCPDPKKDLDLDHISGHAQEINEDPEARNNPDLQKGIKLGHVNKADALHVICKMHHQQAHEREDDIKDGKQPEPMTKTA